MRRVTTIFTAFLVLFAGAYCACASAAAHPVAKDAKAQHACCEHRGGGDNAPTGAQHERRGAHDCPHCGTGATVTAAPPSHDASAAPALLPMFVGGAAVVPLSAGRTTCRAARLSGPPGPTLLGLHCALTL